MKTNLARPSVPAPPIPTVRTDLPSPAASPLHMENVNRKFSSSSSTTATTTTVIANNNHITNSQELVDDTTLKSVIRNETPENRTKQTSLDEPLNISTKPPLKIASKSPVTVMTNTTNGVVLEKKSLDKFLKLATYNSASLLDLNQQAQPQSPKQVSGTKTQIPSSKSSTQLSNNIISLCGKEENSKQSYTSSSSSSISRSKPTPPPPPPKQPPQIINKTNNRQKQEFLIQNFITNNKKLDVDASALLNGFRIPSSRHFCGRLLSANMSSVGSVAASEQSSSETHSSSSSTSSAVLITVPTGAKPKQKFYSSEDEEEEEDEDEGERNYYDNEYNCVVIKTKPKSKKQQIINVSTSSPSTGSSSPKSPEQQYLKRNENHHHIHHHYHHHHEEKNKPVPAQRRSVSSNQQQQRSRNDQIVSPKVRFNDTAKSQMNIANNRNEIKYSSSSKSSEDILNDKHQMTKSYTTTEPFSHKTTQNQPQMEQMAKSADNLLDNKKKDLAKQIDLHTSQHMSPNSSEMTLSKSIKDLRLYVSNSFSPSLIVRPPSNNDINQQHKQKSNNNVAEDHFVPKHSKKSQQIQPVKPQYSVSLIEILEI